MSYQNGYTVLSDNRKVILLKKINKRKANAYFRKGSYSDEIIWENRKFLFPNRKRNIVEGMWVFRSVITDAKNFIENRRIKALPKLPTILWNDKMKKYKGKITATDIDHAYWRIARLQEVISEKTYLKGLTIKNKDLRLAALANLASRKEYQIIENGVITKKTKVLKYDPILQKIYNNIRFECYQHMMNLKQILGDDFICYKTDCIYYVDTMVNRTNVQSYLNSHQLFFKQLIEPDRPTDEVIEII